MLDMAEDGLADVKEVAALLLEEGVHEGGGVEGVGLLGPDHEAQPLALLEARFEGGQISLQVFGLSETDMGWVPLEPTLESDQEERFSKDEIDALADTEARYNERDLAEQLARQLDEFIVSYLRDRLSKGNAIAHRPGWIRERSAAG